MPTLDERLAEAQAKSVSLYLKRTQLEEQRQQIQMAAQQNASQGRSLDMELVKLDGEIDLLKVLVKEAHA